MMNIHQLLEEAVESQLKGDESARQIAWNAFAEAAFRDSGTALQLMRDRISSILGGKSEGGPELAELLATKALSLAPEDEELSITLSRLYLERGLEPQAMQILKNCKPSTPDLSEERDRILGKAAWLLGEKELADGAFYRLAARADAIQPTTLKSSADYFRQNWNRPALRMLLEPLVARLEGDAEVALWMAEWLIEDQDIPEASKWLRLAEEWSLNSPAFKRQVWKTRFALEFPEDEQSMRRIISEVMPESTTDAAKELAEIVGRHPEHWEAHFFLGTCLRRSRELMKAKTHLEASVSLAPFAANVLELSGVLGELNEHQAAYQRSMQADELFEGRNLVAMHNRCLAAIHLREFADAKDCIRRLSERDFVPELLQELRELLATRSRPRSGMRFRST